VDREFVAEHLTEADVFIKYGLLPKAAAHLSLIVERYPRTIVAHQRLAEVYQECGDRESAIRHLVCLTEAYRLRGAGDDALRSINAALEHDPDNPRLAAIKQALREGGPLPAYSSERRSAAVPLEPPVVMDEEVIDLDPDAGQNDGAAAEPAAAPAPPPPTEPSEPPEAAAGAGGGETGPEADSVQMPEPAPVPAAGSEPPADPIPAEPLAAAPVPSPGNRPEEKAVPPPGEAEPEGAGGDFFDLAGAIERELAEEENRESGIPVVDDTEEAVDRLTGLRRAIQDQVGAEDHQTHYQLGIAFKEMGMLDEAIGEFQQASRDPESFVSCCSMLGLCFREKNMPQIAERWYARGLKQVSSGTPDAEERLGLLYDLGELYLAGGEGAKARECFLEVYAISARYREVAARLREAGEPPEGGPAPRPSG
jgi:tetratricopeptide (TPR) repeat protein